MAPSKWKKALIRGMVNRAYNLSSNIEYFESEVKNIQQILQKNGYPIRLIKKICDEFIESQDINANSFVTNNCNNENPKRAKDEKVNYLTIPYVGKPSLKLQQKIRKEMMKENIPIFAAYTTTKVGSYFNLKSKCANLFSSNVVYKFSCFRDENTVYIGETRRQLFRRVEDHAGRDQNSAVFNHLYHCTDCQNVKNLCEQFQIIQKCTQRNILSYESLLISKHQPPLNTQLGPKKGTMTTLRLYD